MRGLPPDVIVFSVASKEQFLARVLLFVLCISLIGLIRAADAFSLADRMRALVSAALGSDLSTTWRCGSFQGRLSA